ncbi:LCHN protein [Ceratobasidium sp. AG-Ba]|nr:LCHN protein [Ceratobasidium sp. AG-Ba]
MNTGPCSSGLNGHNELQSPQSSTESARTWVDSWRIYEVCMLCAGVCGWIGWGLGLRDRGGAGVHLDGPDEVLRRQDPVSLQSISAPLPTASPTHHRQSRSLHHAEHDRRWAHRRAHVLELMTLFHKYAAFLHAHLSDIIDSHDGQPQSLRKAKTPLKFHSKSASQTQALRGSGASEERVLVLTSKDMLALDLGPLSTTDTQFLEWFGTTIAKRDRRVVVKRTWRDMVSAVVGSPW